MYVEDLILFSQLGRPRQFGDSITYLDGNRWNWNPRNVVVQMRPGDPHVYVAIYAPDCAHFTTVDLSHGVEARVQGILHEGRQGFPRPHRTWPPREAVMIFTALKGLGIPLRVQDLRRSIAAVISDRLPPEWAEI